MEVNSGGYLPSRDHLPLNTVTANFVAIFVFFGTASSFIERISFSEIEAKLEAILFLVGCLEVSSTWIDCHLDSHLQASQSARAKSTIHSCGIYTVQQGRLLTAQVRKFFLFSQFSMIRRFCVL